MSEEEKKIIEMPVTAQQPEEPKKELNDSQLSQDLTGKIAEMIIKGNYPLPVAISALEMLKFEFMQNAYLNAMLAKQSQQKRIVQPTNLNMPKNLRTK